MKGWQSSESARHYMRVAEVVIPNRHEILGMVAELTVCIGGEQPRILDLGCGHGDVTAAILEKSPRGDFCLVDFSDAMLEASRERFADNPRVRILKHDLDEGLPEQSSTAPFDVIVSAFALHHVDPQARLPLFAGIHDSLRAGGALILTDRFRAESETLATWEFDSWIEWMTNRIREHFDPQVSVAQVRERQLASEKKLGDKPGTLWETEQDLRDAGFVHVDCVAKHSILGTVVAAKGGRR